MWSFGVPNVPCGVERQIAWVYEDCRLEGFLMYRVELKGISILASAPSILFAFLMYRVELKGHYVGALQAFVFACS